MDADEIVGPKRGFGQRGDRQSGGVGGEDHIGADHRLRLFRHLRLDAALLEHGFDDEIAPRQRRIIGGRGDPRQQRRLVGFARLAARHLAGDALVAGRLAPVGAVLIAVDQHHLEAIERRDIGDARAHEAGAENADLLQGRRRDVFRAGARPSRVRSSKGTASGSSPPPPASAEYARTSGLRRAGQGPSAIAALHRPHAEWLSPPDNCPWSRGGRWRWRRARSSCRPARTLFRKGS